MDTKKLLSSTADLISRADSLKSYLQWMGETLDVLQKAERQEWREIVQQHDKVSKDLESHVDQILIQAARQLVRSVEPKDG